MRGTIKTSLVLLKQTWRSLNGGVGSRCFTRLPFHQLDTAAATATTTTIMTTTKNDKRDDGDESQT